MNTAGDDARTRVDQAVWSEPAMRAALARRDVGAVYQQLRRYGVSQRRIAGLTGQSQPEVSDIMRGRQVMAYDVLSRIADGLGAPRGLMGLAYDGSVAASLIGAHASDREVMELPERREFLGLLAKVAMGASLTAADLALLSTPAVATPAPSRVGRIDVEQLAEFAQVLWTQEKRLGGGAVRDAVIAQLAWAQSLLQSSYTDAVGRGLHAGLADLLGLAGWASHDVGMPGAALRYMGQALAAARQADDSMRAALALEQIGRVYLRQSQLEDALQVFQLGVIAAERAHSGETTALLLASQARTYALLGNEPQALECMQRAEEFLANGPYDVRLPDPRGFDHGTWISENGRIHTVLAGHDTKHCDSAIDILSGYTASTDKVRVKRRAFGMVELATCHFRHGDIAEGCDVGHRVVDMATDIRSTRLTEHMDMLHSEAEKHPKHDDAADLAHRIAQMPQAS